MVAFGVPPEAASRALVESVMALMDNWHGQAGVNLPGGSVVSRIYGMLTFGECPPTGRRHKSGRFGGAEGCRQQDLPGRTHKEN
jgi:hypothetical protein